MIDTFLALLVLLPVGYGLVLLARAGLERPSKNTRRPKRRSEQFFRDALTSSRRSDPYNNVGIDATMIAGIRLLKPEDIKNDKGR